VQVARDGGSVRPEIMIPLTGTVAEMERTAAMTRKVADAVLADASARVPYLVGTMIEVPRACLVADGLADHAEFFSFGTNDLTQMTFGYSRDDAGKFLPYYLEHRLLAVDPFAELDQDGVGELVRLGIARGRRRHPGLKVGICGEHGGDPSSVEFCHREGMDYVSCSPFRVPIAWLAAAQAQLRQPRAGRGSRNGGKESAGPRGRR
jgi:pyruvate,orthophosphate dikinase